MPCGNLFYGGGKPNLEEVNETERGRGFQPNWLWL